MELKLSAGKAGVRAVGDVTKKLAYRLVDGPQLNSCALCAGSNSEKSGLPPGATAFWWLERRFPGFPGEIPAPPPSLRKRPGRPPF